MNDVLVDSTDKFSELAAITDQPEDHLLAAHPWLWNKLSNLSLCGGDGRWNATCNLTDSDDHAPAVNYGAAILVLIPMLTVFGNSLVVISVIREKTLRTATNYFIVSLATVTLTTVTNYFIVSLATSDVMVALLVMPLSIYGEVGIATSRRCPSMKAEAVFSLVCYRGRKREALTCRYCFYSRADFEVLRPTGATRCTDQGDIWHEGSSLPNFTLLGSSVVVYGPQNLENGIYECNFP